MYNAMGKEQSKTYLHGVDSEWLELTTCSRHMELVLKSRRSERTVKFTKEGTRRD